MTRQEAIDVIRQCHLLRGDIDRLLIKCHEALKPPVLSVIQGTKGKSTQENVQQNEAEGVE